VSWLANGGNIAAIFGAVAAAVVVVNASTAFWRSGPGRRRFWSRNFCMLEPGVRPAYVQQLFGEPTFSYPYPAKRLDLDENQEKRADELLTVRIWPLGTDGYLMTWSKDDAIVVFSLTTASRWFHPTIRIGPPSGSWHADIRLGQTCFSELSRPPEKWSASTGGAAGQNSGYIESHFHGRPGSFQRWYCGWCEVGYSKYLGARFNGTSSNRAQPPEELINFRKRTSINSIAVAGMSNLDVRLYPSPGPPSRSVRLLKNLGLGDRWRAWRGQRKALGKSQT
jgi:hypothetical protein